MKKSILSYIGYLKKNQRIWFAISVVLYLLLSGFLYAISMTCFVNSEGSNLLTSGMSGLALIISRYILPDLGVTLDVNLMFSILYVVFNIMELEDCKWIDSKL